MIEIFDDRVVISNPGGLPKGLKPKNFGKVSMARNPIIASLLQRSDYIEKMGTGIRRMLNSMEEAKLPAPEFEMDGFFIVTMKRESYIRRIKEKYCPQCR
jgi:ATP-dependent DNA helicase RecG